MEITFWGVRGSIPTPISSNEIKEKIKKSLILSRGIDLSSEENLNLFLKKLPINIYGTIGGNTPCVSIVDEDDNFLIFDMGSGARYLGFEILKMKRFQNNKVLNIFFSHTHWDHIQGLPFFAPAYNKEFKLKMYSPIKNLEKRLITQQLEEFFPVPLKNIPASIEFITLDLKYPFKVSKNSKIEITKLNHPGNSYAYKLISKEKTVIYATDTEFYKIDEKFMTEIGKKWQNTDILIFDAQYTPEEYIKKINWGHSSTMVAVDIGLQIKAKKLILFHHDPIYNDDFIINTVKKAYKYMNMIEPNSNMEIIAAYEGLKIEL